jgi:hypothetical protein
MDTLGYILINIILPVFVLIGIGAALDRIFHPDLNTLSKLNFYVFVPAFILINFLDSELSPGDMAGIVQFRLVHVALLMGIGWLACRRGPLVSDRPVVMLGATFFNGGNYGIPLIVLAFGAEWVSAQAVVLMVNNLLLFTVGIAIVQRKSGGWLRFGLALLKVPVIWAVVLGVALSWSGRQLPGPLYDPLNYLARGLIPVALLTLGVQLSRSKMSRNVLPLATVTGLRLLVSPLLAAGLVLLFGFGPTLSAVLITACALPVAVNVFILSEEYDRDPDLASQAVFWSTLLSVVTVSAVLLLVR